MADEPGFGHSVVLAGATILGGVALFVTYVSWVPGAFLSFYASREVELPLPTIWMLRLSSLTVNYWWAILPIAIVGPLPPLLLMSRGKGQRILAHMAVIQLLISLFTIAALWLPMQKLRHSVGSGTAVSPSSAPQPPTPTAAPR